MIPVHAKPYKGTGTIGLKWMRHMRIDIYSDTVCPWCYLGKRRFELALAARPEYEPRVTWRPFELNPIFPSTAGPCGLPGRPPRGRAARRGGAGRAHAPGRGQRHRISIRIDRTHAEHAPFPPVDRACGPIQPPGRRQGAGHAGYFEEGCDIGDIDELVRLAVDSGLSERESRSAIVLREGQDGVIAAERHAGVLGITGVPTFVFDGQYTISGAQEVGTMTRILDQVAGYAAARDVAS